MKDIGEIRDAAALMNEGALSGFVDTLDENSQLQFLGMRTALHWVLNEPCPWMTSSMPNILPKILELVRKALLAGSR